MADISSEWESFSATITRYVYQTPSVTQDENNISPATVVASYPELQPGATCPAGYVFADKSTVLATPSIPTTTKDKSEMHKDDRSNPKDLEGNVYENEWHQGVRADFSNAPKTDYKTRKFYVNPRWELEYQLLEKDKERPVKIQKVKDSVGVPEWIRKAYGKK